MNVLIRIDVDSVHIEMTVLSSGINTNVIHMLGVPVVSILVVSPGAVLQPGKNMSSFVNRYILFRRQAIIRSVFLNEIVD